MPITHRAIKKLKHDRRRSAARKSVRTKTERLVKAARTKPSDKTLSLAFSALDKASKTHAIHKNTAARLKSRLSKRLTKK